MNNCDVNIIREVTKLVIEEMNKKSGTYVPLGVSNRHLHLSRADLDSLFGVGYELTRMKDLKQTGQYACEETVTLKGPKGELKKVRILGPVRPETQVEVSVTDSFSLGIKVPVAESGMLKDASPIEIVGPKGSVRVEKGAIAAYRHIHMPENLAAKLGLSDKDIVSCEIGGKRGVTVHNVLVRVSKSFVLEMHLDVDEANAFGAKNDDLIRIIV